MINYYRQFLPNAASSQAALVDFLTVTKLKDSPDRVIGRPVPLPSRAVSEPIVPPAAPAGSTIPPAAPSTLLAPNIQTAKIPVQQPVTTRSGRTVRFKVVHDV
ncbi:hypothetical protein ACJJTC_011511 [Scirpophaga incertulas]